MKRKYKAGALVTNVAQLLDHEYFIVRFGIRDTPTFGHPRREDAVAAWDNGEVYDGWLITEVEK